MPDPGLKWTPLLGGALGWIAERPGIDANLAFALATDWIAFRREGAPPPRRIPVILEMAEPDLHGNGRLTLTRLPGDVPAAYPKTATRCVTSSLTRAELLRTVARSGRPGQVRRMALQMPLVPQRARAEPRGAPPSSPPRAPMRSRGEVLLGVIDSGCPFAQLRDAGGRTRVRNLWIQDASYGDAAAELGARPRDFGYGLMLRGRELDRLIRRRTRFGSVDEASAYRDAGMDILDRRFAHGGAVLDLAAGAIPLSSRVFSARLPHDGSAPDHQVLCPPSWAMDPGPAASVDIAFVQLPRDVVQDSGSAGLVRQLLDGIRFILTCAGTATKRVVINVSDGSSRGSHDGQSIFERAIVELIAAERKSHHRDVVVVFSAGNSFDERRHAVFEHLCPAEWRAVRMRLLPDAETWTQLVVRVPASISDLEMRLDPPGKGGRDDGRRGTLRSGQSRAWRVAGEVVAAVVFPKPVEGEESVELVASFAPTRRSDGGTCAAAGDWTIAFKSPSGSSLPVHLYIPRSQVNIGALPRSRQPRFIDASEGRDYDPAQHLRMREEDPRVPRSPIRRSGTLNSLATGPRNLGVMAVGGRYLRDSSDRRPALYSSAGPAVAVADVTKRQAPDALAPTEVSRAVHGIPARGVLSGQRVHVRGTSFAAPQLVREILNAPPSRQESADRQRGRRASPPAVACGHAGASVPQLVTKLP